jgi:hypothetical protein
MFAAAIYNHVTASRLSVTGLGVVADGIEVGQTNGSRFLPP